MVTNGSAVKKMEYKQLYFDYMNPNCDLAPEAGTSIFLHELRLTIMHHRIEFGHNGSVVQKILAGQTITDNLNLRCDLDLEHSNPAFSQDTGS